MGDSDWYATYLVNGDSGVHLDWSAGGKQTSVTYVSLVCVKDYVAPTPVNGACSATHYACTAGTSANNASGTTSYTWNCNGLDGGTNASCSEAKQLGTVSVSSNVAASWTITGPATIIGSGTAQTSINQPVGTYTITWGAVSGYTKPSPSSFTLTNAGTISFNGIYTSSAVCTGSIPANATAYDAEESTGLSANTAWTYANPDTATKCQYGCNNGYGWSGSSCAVLTPVTTFTSSSTSLPAGGGSVNLNWSITNGAGGGSCTGYSTTNITGWSTAGTGGKSVTGTNVAVTVPSTTTFDLDCWNGIGTAAVRKSVTVTVAAAAPTVDLKINTSDGPVSATSGSNLDISWTTTNASSCSITGAGWAAYPVSPIASGSKTISAIASDTYTLDCQNSSGVHATDTVQVNLSCTPSCESWGACSATCGGGTQTQSCTNASCGSYTNTQACGTQSCGTGNWREVAPGQ